MSSHETHYEIDPRGGVAGVYLQQSPSDVRQVLGDPKEATSRPAVFNYGGLSVWFQDGHASMIIAQDDFPIRTAEGLGIGDGWLHLIEKVPSIAYWEVEALWRADNSLVWFEIARPLRSGEQARGATLPEMYQVTDPDRAFIQAIFVMQPDRASAGPWNVLPPTSPRRRAPGVNSRPHPEGS